MYAGDRCGIFRRIAKTQVVGGGISLKLMNTSLVTSVCVPYLSGLGQPALFISKLFCRPNPDKYLENTEVTREVFINFELIFPHNLRPKGLPLTLQTVYSSLHKK